MTSDVTSVLIFGLTFGAAIGVIAGVLFAPKTKFPLIPTGFTITHVNLPQDDQALRNYYQRKEVAIDLLNSWGFNLQLDRDSKEAYCYNGEVFDQSKATFIPNLYDAISNDSLASKIRSIIKDAIPVEKRKKDI